LNAEEPDTFKLGTYTVLAAAVAIFEPPITTELLWLAVLFVPTITPALIASPILLRLPPNIAL